MMIELYSPSDEVELSLIRSLLDAAEIPFYVHNDHFGSMYVGLPIKHFNRKTVMVYAEFEESAREVLADFLQKQDVAAEQARDPVEKWSVWEKLRLTFEAFFCHWIVPRKSK